jgi:hypothetical protein
VTRVRAASTRWWSPRDEVARAARRLDHVGVARVERREREADQAAAVVGAEVGDHGGALDERPADRPGVGVAERDVPAAAGGVARRGQREPQRRQPGVVGLDEQVGQRPGLRGDRRHARLRGQLGARLDGGEAEDHRRTGQEALDAVDRVVGGPIANWSR